MKPEELVRVLADGKPHSGEDLARTFGVSRAAIWKQMAKLTRWGLKVDARRARGYQLESPIQPIDAQGLIAQLQIDCPCPLERVDCFLEIDSTNRYLLDNPPQSSGTLTVCLAEYQTAGRGRRGRQWQMPFGSGLSLSTGWSFAESPEQLSGLTLAVGVSICRLLWDSYGLDIALKWPNDLVFDDRKLGGVLVESTLESQGGCHVVVGVGINCRLPRSVLGGLCDWPGGAIDLYCAVGEASTDRQKLVTQLVHSLGRLFADYARGGLAPYLEEWRSADYLRDKPVSVQGARGSSLGLARGIDNHGALLVEKPGGKLMRILAGDVSIRPSP